MARAYLCAFHEWLDKAQALSNEEFGSLMRAALLYSKTGMEGEMNGAEKILWPVIRMEIDRTTDAYAETCARNAENGKKGGRPKKTQNNRSVSKPGKEKPTETQNNRSVFLGQNKNPKNPNQNQIYKSNTNTKVTSPPLSPPPGENPLERIENLSLRAAVEDWVSYKKEKNQSYKPQGLKALISQILGAEKENGADAVVSLIRESMAANYQGIVFDRLKKKQFTPPRNSLSAIKITAAPPEDDLERLERMLGCTRSG